METTVAPVKEDKALEQALRAKIEATALVEVKDADSFAAAGENVKAIIATEKAWNGYWEPLRVAAQSVVAMILDKRKGPAEQLDKKKNDQKAVMKKWADEEERKRKAEELKAQEEEKKRAEEAALATAAELEAQGRSEEASAVLDNPPPVAQPVKKSAVPTGFGGMTQKYYSAEVFDLMSLAKAVVEKKVPIQAIQGNSTFLNGQAKLLKETMKWPGVKVNVR